MGVWEACGLGRVTGVAAGELIPSEFYHAGRYCDTRKGRGEVTTDPVCVCGSTLTSLFYCERGLISENYNSNAFRPTLRQNGDGESMKTELLLLKNKHPP